MSINLKLATEIQVAAANPFVQPNESPASNIVSLNGKEREISKIENRLSNPEIELTQKKSFVMTDKILMIAISIMAAIVAVAAITCGLLIAPWTAGAIIGGTIFLGLLAVEIAADSSIY